MNPALPEKSIGAERKGGVKILIGCGRSGGHIFPGIALAQELVKADKACDILMVCSRRPLDSRILKASGYKFGAIPSGLAGALIFAMGLLLGFRPSCVVGFGGFIGGAVIFAAWLLRIPGIVHEQNVIPGRANRFASIFAKRVVVSFRETENFFDKRKTVKLGNPVRVNFLNLDKAPSRERFGLDRERFTVFVTGGSQGAENCL